MAQRLRFALNHMVSPRAEVDRFFATAHGLGIDAVEIRNDLPGVAIADGTEAQAIQASAVRHGVRILTINALQRFNDWTPQRDTETRALAEYAAAAGAEAVVLCPVNDWGFRPGEAARLDGLRQSLAEIAPILSARGLTGLVEPLGFAESSLRLKREAIDAIDAVGAANVLRVVHDTFHHAVASETSIFPERTGLVHVSGVEDGSIALSSMRDSHRVLVGPRDRLDNLGQLRRMIGGYSGFVSFEPFAESVQALPDIGVALADSMAYLSRGLESEAA